MMAEDEEYWENYHGFNGKDRAEFKSWYRQVASRRGWDPDPDDPRHYYDFRAAWRDGYEAPEGEHWDSRYKKPGHPNEVVGGVNTRTGRPVR